MNGKVRLYLDPARFNKALIRPVYIGLKLNDILLTQVSIKYHTLINAGSGYHNPKLDERSSYLTLFSCPFGRYRYIRLQFGATPAGNLSQKKKTAELFSGIQMYSVLLLTF